MADSNTQHPKPGTGFGQPVLPLLIFTDLDGTLLDHDDYSFDAALPALQRLAALNIPVIPVTSKTLAELSDLRRQLGNNHPCIAENGGLIALSAGYLPAVDSDIREQDFLVTRLSSSYRDIVDILRALRKRCGYRFRGFSDMDDGEVADCTGLTGEQAHNARRRLCTEPLLWADSGEALETFRGQLAEHDLQLVKGGRFWHVMGRHDKADAMRLLCRRYRDNGFRDFTTVALGDSPNDLLMLNAADIAIVIPPRHGEPLRPSPAQRTITSELPGPSGWNREMLELIERFGSGRDESRCNAAT